MEFRLLLRPDLDYRAQPLIDHTSAHRRVHTMVGDFLAQPAHTHAEAKPSLRHQIQRGDLLGRDDRIAFRDQRDAGA